MQLSELTPEKIHELSTTGDPTQVANLMDAYRERLEQIVAVRLDHRLQGRIDPADVVQDTIISALSKFNDYATRQQDLPFLLWLRLEALQKLIDVHRAHLGAQMRDAGREVSLHSGSPAISSGSLAAQLIGRLSTASRAVMRLELKSLIEDAVNGMQQADREMLALRHFEELTNAEAARVLGLSPTAAYNRYARALRRLKEVLDALPGGIEALMK